MSTRKTRPGEMADTHFSFRRHYDSIEEFCNVEPSENNRDIYYDNIQNHDNRPELLPQWLGVGSYDAVRRIVREGWPQGVARLDALTAEVPPVVGLRRRPVRGDHGDELDIHAINTGNADRAWTRRQRRVTVGGRANVCIHVHISAAATVKSEALFWRGAAAVKLSDALTEAGYDVEIVGQLAGVGMNANGPKLGLCDTFTIKSSGMPLDKNSVASVVCLAGFMRTFGFAHYTRIPMAVRGSYGWPTHHLPDDLRERQMVTGLENACNAQTASAFIQQAIQQITAGQLAA